MTHGVSIADGRSCCPKCKRQIAAKDNIPLLSYFLLKGKCRNCKTKIPIRYPLIEFSTGIVFVLTWLVYSSCSLGSILIPGSMCWWSASWGDIALLLSFFLAVILTAIFIIDLDEKIIPDSLVFIGLIVFVFAHMFGASDRLFEFLLTGTLAGVFILLLHLITKGKGMGLGDVKFALMGGVILGWQLTILWLFLAFLTGAIIGIILILLGKAKFGKQIPFGPFMAMTLIVAYLIGPVIIEQWMGML